MELGLQRDCLLGQHRSDVTRQRNVQLFAKTKAATRKPANSGLFSKTRKSPLEELGMCGAAVK